MTYLFIALISFVGGMLQSVIGFGAGIVIMIVLPSLMPMSLAAAVSGAICTPLNVSLALRYRRSANLKLILFPALIYVAVSTAAIYFSRFFDTDRLKPVFGAVLILLSVYFLFFSGKVKVKGTPLTAFICSSISGLLGGFFGVGGPMMTLYFLSITTAKEEYMGSLSISFLIANVFMLMTRIANGIITISSLPAVAAGIAAVLTGRVFGSKICDRLNIDQIKTGVYIFLAFAGLLNIINSL